MGRGHRRVLTYGATAIARKRPGTIEKRRTGKHITHVAVAAQISQLALEIHVANQCLDHRHGALAILIAAAVGKGEGTP